MTQLKWWQKAVFYQIYPRSFADSNGDGIGDLPGIIGRLDTLQSLGIGGIWLSPHYPSPMIDCGYDISDYTAVAPEYGTLEDFKRLLDGAHQRGMGIILDLVLNHTSDQHTWFLESKSSRENPKHDWYVWHDGLDGNTPNNWVSPFGGPAWEYAPEIGQYYYHYFFKEQPDLNWRNPQVKQAMFDCMRFWLDLGVDGFRLDAIGTIYEDPELQDHTASMSQAEMFKAWQTAAPEGLTLVEKQSKRMFVHQVDQAGMQELLRELRAVVDEYKDRVLVGESDEIIYCNQDMLHMVFNFPLMRTDRLTPEWVRLNQEQRLASLAALDCPTPGAWPCNTLGNHDSPRVVSRYGDGEHDEAIARISLALMLTLRGTPFLYNGEEIGMTDLYLQDIGQFRDTLGIWRYELESGLLQTPPPQALKIAAQATRDKCRTPFQWSGRPNAGFSPPGVRTWLPANPNYQEGVNFADQEQDPGSLLNFYRKLIHLRNHSPALVEGSYEVLDLPEKESRSVLAFLRWSEKQTCGVVLNMTGRAQEIDLQAALRKAGITDKASVLYSNEKRQGTNLSTLSMAPFEILICELS